MYDCMIQLAEEFKKNTIFLYHIEILEEFKKYVKPEAISMLTKYRPSFYNAKGYLFALQLLKQNKDNDDIPLFLKNQIAEVLTYQSIDKFEESCEKIGSFLEQFFIEIIGMPNSSSEILQKMSPVGRRVVMELRSILHRKGIIRGLINYISFHNENTTEEALLLEEMVRGDRYFFPFKRGYRKFINQMSVNNLEKKRYLMFYLSFISFQRTYIDLLYELITDSVPIITTDVFSNLRVKSLNQINLFCISTSSTVFILPDIKFYLVSSENNKITQLLFSKSKKISYSNGNLNISLKGIMLDSNFHITY